MVLSIKLSGVTKRGPMTDVFAVDKKTITIQGPKHISELQALRGVAALLVCLHHCTFYYSYNPLLREWSEILLNAHAAVVCFYVLSGYVLFQSLSRSPMSTKHSLAFYLRRLLRIYPALWLACCLALCYVVVFHHHLFPQNVSPWVNRSYRDSDISSIKILACFVGFGSSLPLPMWSILLELIGSLLMPLFVLISTRSRKGFCVLVIGLLYFSFTFGEHTRMGVGVYVVDFALGIAVGLIQPSFSRRLGRSRSNQLVGYTALTFLLFGRDLGRWNFTTSYHSPGAALVEALAAMVTITVVVTSPSTLRFLQSRFLIWIGDISYSLYLLHLPILVIVAGLCGEILNIPLFTGRPVIATISLLVTTLAIAIPLSALSYRFIEIPALEYAKAASHRFMTPNKVSDHT
jgi:peptidoglycan/LPS O-acetylase OafA/YrhL